ncbi:MAG TPA: SprT-like domain-containing protein [Cytophagaceae bacterium]
MELSTPQQQAAYKIFKKYLPDKTVNYCFRLWLKYQFNFFVTKSRQTKLGDYSYNYQSKKHTITINHDLNKYSFLITYLHEVAHLTTGLKHWHKRIKPHGPEWKESFQELVVPLLKNDAIPDDLLEPLFDYINNPKASSCSDISLLKALGQYDTHTPLPFLSDVKNGQVFRFQKTVYRKEKTLRTRALCVEIKTGRKYYISEGAQVEIIETAEPTK